jgi:ABC-type transport system involved in cytochrome bd biosynthesis fused ATPase/permease subunit
LIFTVLSAASGNGRATLSVMLVGFLKVHLGSICLV